MQFYFSWYFLVRSFTNFSISVVLMFLIGFSQETCSIVPFEKDCMLPCVHSIQKTRVKPQFTASWYNWLCMQWTKMSMVIYSVCIIRSLCGHCIATCIIWIMTSLHKYGVMDVTQMMSFAQWLYNENAINHCNCVLSYIMVIAE